MHLYTDAHKELHALLPKHLIDTCVEIAVPKGTCLFTSGEKPTHMFFVVSGEVVLERTRRGFMSEASLKSPRYHCHELGVTHEALYRCIYAMEKDGVLTRGNGFLCWSPRV